MMREVSHVWRSARFSYHLANFIEIFGKTVSEYLTISSKIIPGPYYQTFMMLYKL